MSSLICRDDVIQGYRTFLGRDPETEEVIELFLSKNLDLWSWISIIAGSEEAKRYQLDRLSPAYMEQIDPRQTEVDTSPEALRLLLHHVSKAWSKLGRDDPYWSVLTTERYRSSTITAMDIEEFYRSGAQEAAVFDAICVRNNITINHSDSTILDFGCGVGRIGEHFARRYARYIGVDISSAHLQLARQRFGDQSIENSILLLLLDFLENSPTFDIFFSVITLQHCPPPIIYFLLRHCLAQLRPDGYAFFQLPCHLHNYRFRLKDYLSKIETDPDMEMHALPQSYVFRALAECNLVPIEVIPFPRIGPIGFSYAFLAKKMH